MTDYSGYFSHLHTNPTGWIDLFEVLYRARQELPNSSFRPRLKQLPDEFYQESAERSLKEAFKAVSKEVGAAAGDRFQDGHWPAQMSAEAAYFLGVMLATALKTVAAIGPTPERPLRPTIVPFPAASVSEVALWFTTGWWFAIGGQIYQMEMCKGRAI